MASRTAVTATPRRGITTTSPPTCSTVASIWPRWTGGSAPSWSVTGLASPFVV
jgi:hypothetical protein